ncbi:hypothetical protein ILUMI_27221 [Ignelater luminosus]|uniref:Uncharacterized protein n=1 Tax=Ignelater luminosus TaxID=2038154 RepID=A0A8K0C3M5_IGNLU|nr:hypothetical protein ILUMI_27221 [Ignelater luminosus]
MPIDVPLFQQSESIWDCESHAATYKPDGKFECDPISNSQSNNTSEMESRRRKSLSCKSKTRKKPAKIPHSYRGRTVLHEQSKGEDKVIKGITRHNIKKYEGMARKTRRRCKECYRKYSALQGKKVAETKTRKVTTYCEVCPGQPSLCLDCFNELHNIVDAGVKFADFLKPFLRPAAELFRYLCQKQQSEEGLELEEEEESLLMPLNSGPPWVCFICLKQLKDKSGLRKHIMTHSTIKPYVCDICTKAFRRNSHLVNHKRRHLSTKERGAFSPQAFYGALGETNMDASSDSGMECIPPIVVEGSQNNSLNLLPEKTRQRYEVSYNQFMNWREAKDIKSSFSEDVLMTYFRELSEKIKPSSLWAQYSMLRSTLSIYNYVDITQYLKLRALLRRKSDGYKPQKSKILTSQEVNQFLDDAPDDKYLFTKVALIVGITGACRKQELSQLKIDDIEDLGSAVLIRILDTKTKKPRAFTITGEFYEIYKKYATLRPSNVNERRFFLNYQNQKCTRQPVGKNKFGNIPKQIATYLHLENPELYTGHCFRRSSATCLSMQDY